MILCGECGATMVRRDSKYGPFYGCTRFPECDGAHGMHPDGKPLGTPADKKTKAARIAAHDAFDRYWKPRGKKARGVAYAWLARELGQSIHFGALSLAECADVIAHLNEHGDRLAQRLALL